MAEVDKYLEDQPEVLKEGKEFPQAVIDKVASLTDKNYHQEARHLVAKTMKDKKLMKAYESIIELHDFFGYVPQELSELRYKIDQMLKDKLSRTFSNHNSVWMAM